MNNINMLYYDRIDVSEGIDINKTSASKECDICHYWYFSNKGLKFQTYVCNKCHDLLMMPMNLYLKFQKTLKVLIITVLSVELAKVKTYNYCKIFIWLKKVEHYKTKHQEQF